MPGKKCYGRGAVSVKSAREAARFGEVPEIAEQGRRCRQSTPLWRAAITQRPMFVPEGTPSRRAAGDCDSSVARPPAAGAVSLGYRTAQGFATATTSVVAWMGDLGREPERTASMIPSRGGIWRAASATSSSPSSGFRCFNVPAGQRLGTEPQRCSAAKDGVDACQDKLQAPRRNLPHTLGELLPVEGHDKGDVRDRIL